MAGTYEGGVKSRDKNLAKDPDFYKKIGSRGGKNSNTGGFAKRKDCNCSLIFGPHVVPECAGKKGGSVSRRGKPSIPQTPEDEFRLPEIKPKKRFALWGR